MAVTTNYGTGASGTSWTTPTNANANDGAYATYTIAAKNTTGNVNTITNFGFDSSIPANSTINSVTLEVEHKVSTTAGIANLDCTVAVSGTPGTYNTDSTEPLADTARSYVMTRPGGGAWTRDDLLNGTFTVLLRARSGNNATSVVYSWDYARVVVDYTPQNFTLTCNNGSYSTTGQSATVNHNRAISVSNGSYSTTGQSADITYVPAAAGYELIANAGSYTQTGQSAALDKGFALTASAGSYAQTGQSSTIAHDRALTASAGSYALAGQGATIQRTHELSASAGSYSLTGQSAVVAHDRVLDAQQGSYSLTGEAATLTRDRALDAAAGSYSVTGQNATISYGVPALNYELTAQAGSYSLSGQNVTVARGRLLTASAGAYSLQGYAATVAHDRTITASVGSYTYSGVTALISNSGNLSHYELICNAGVYAFTGGSSEVQVLAGWDTDQGVARNLARNLRFERVEDADSRAFGGESTTGYQSPYVRADGKCRAIGGTAVTVYRDARGTGVSKANGYTRAKGGDCYTFHYQVTAGADSGCSAAGGGAVVSGGRCSVVADGRVVPFVGYQCFSEGGLAVASGIQNPSDEHVVTLMHLLTRKQKQGIRRQW